MLEEDDDYYMQLDTSPFSLFIFIIYTCSCASYRGAHASMHAWKTRDFHSSIVQSSEMIS